MAQEDPKVETKSADSPKENADKQDLDANEGPSDTCPENARGWQSHVPTMNMGKDSAIPYPYVGSNCKMV